MTPGRGRAATAALLVFLLPVAGHAGDDTSAAGLRYKIRAVPAAAEPRPSPTPPAPATPLSEGDAARLLERLPPLPSAAPPPPVAMRGRTPRPPRAGVTVHDAFPPAATGPAPTVDAAGPLAVLRHAPEGEVPVAASVSVTFSQAMTDLAAVSALAAEAVPVRFTPQPPGRWRWVGTRTLLFEPDGGRLPMATEYTVEVPAGTRSVTGSRLAEATRWGFVTPALELRESAPGGTSVRLEPTLFASFDQRVDPAAILAALRVRADQGKAPALRLASAAEVAADEEVDHLARSAGDGRWLALRATAPLAAATAFTLVLPAGTRSAEGPRPTAADQSWAFRTYGPLRHTGVVCSAQKGGPCPLSAKWRLTFSNPIDAKAFRPEMVRVTPPLPDLEAYASGSDLAVYGRARARTKYTVELAPTLRDTFGQTLGKAVAVTVSTAPMPQMVHAPTGDFVVLDPSAPPRFSVWSSGYAKLHVRAVAVGPRDWPRFEGVEKPPRPEPVGPVVLDTTLAVTGSRDELVETHIDLAAAFRAAPSTDGRHLWLDVTGVQPPPPPSSHVDVVAYRLPQSVRVWVHATRIGLSTLVDESDLLAWATTLSDGAPLAGATLELLGTGTRATTDRQGIARLPLATSSAFGLLARSGSDVAFLPADFGRYRRGAGWTRAQAGDRFRWAVYDDRSLYRPGEEVKVKGWIRRESLGRGGQLHPWEASVSAIDYALADAQGVDVTKGSAPVNAWGGFDLSLSLPPDMNLGQARLELRAANGEGQTDHPFMVEEFRRPEFEVSAAASQAPHFAGGTATVTTRAQYFSGGPVADAPVEWRVETGPTTYRPPHRDGFLFGAWSWREATTTQELEARTGTEGAGRLAIDVEGSDPPVPHGVWVQARVSDVNRQEWTASASLLVHPADVYVGVRLPRLFVERGTPLTVDAIVTDLDGAAVAGRPVEMVAERFISGRYGEQQDMQVEEAGRCAVTSGPEAVSCTITPGVGGSYRLRATVHDARGRANATETSFWVAGAAPAMADRGADKDAVALVLDREHYQAGETAEVLVVSPFVPAEGLLTVNRSGVVQSQRFHVTEATVTLRVPIDESLIPGAEVRVDVVGSAARADAAGRRRPAFASGTVALPVPPLSRTLAVAVAPRAALLAPGESTTLDVEVKDAAGRPLAQGEVALAVVDEAVLALIGREPPDPVSAFYLSRDAGVDKQDLRSSVVLDTARLTAEQIERMQADLFGVSTSSAASMRQMITIQAETPAVEPDGAPVRLRRSFTPLALFAASVVTDADGRAQVPLTVPDSLTRYRVVALAATRGTQFGAGESTLTVRLPLMARPSPPRFLSFGDRFELPVVVQNQTDRAQPVDVAVRARGLSLTAGAGRHVTVPAHDRVEVRLPMAVDAVGTALVQVAAAGGGASDAAEVTLPVLTPATTEAVAVYGTLDAGAVAQPVRPPADAIPSFGGLEMTTSSTALQSLTDAVLYLAAYPYECSEQVSSRVLAVAALRDVLSAFRAEGLPPAAGLEAAVARDLQKLKAMQNGDGGFGFWRVGEPSWPYLSLHVMRALERARAKGFTLPEGMLDAARRYLKSMEKNLPRDTPLAVRRTLVADALNVRHLLGDSDPARARELVREGGVEGLSFEALGWLLPVVGGDAGSRADADAIRRRLANGVSETAGAAHFAEAYGEDGPYLLLSSDQRADAIVLEALIADQPQSDLIPKLVEGLLGHRRAGRWGNTQENAFVLLALDRYFQTYEKVTPDFVARAWLGEQMVGEHAFRGRGTERHEVTVPMELLAAGGRRDLVLAKEGAGRLYYRLGLRYAPASLRLDPLDAGFTVERKYEAIDSKGDVRRDADGTWHVRAGARVRVRLTMAATGRRAHVALVDPLPAGLEPQNPVLAATVVPDDDDEDATAWWKRTWFVHQNLRDDRAEAFTPLLFEGVYTYSYVTLATTPGSFVAAPAHAEEMYHPETFGRSGTDMMIVE